MKEIHIKKEKQKDKRLEKSRLNFDLSWWVKWASSIILLAAMVLRGGQAFPFVGFMSIFCRVSWLVMGWYHVER